MKLREFLAEFVKLVEENPEAAEMEVYYRHGGSGDCGPLSTPHVTDRIDPETGPFEFENEKYIQVYGGY